MKSKAMLKDYSKSITDVASQGDAWEESFYSCLETLLQQFAASSGRSEAHVTTLPKKTEAGNPDFRVWNGQDHIIGYVLPRGDSPSAHHRPAGRDRCTVSKSREPDCWKWRCHQAR